MTMNGVEKKSQPQLVKLDRSSKLAEQWVNNMSRSSVSEKLAVVELEGRPARQVHLPGKLVAESFICIGSQSLRFCRLGIGASVPRESKVALPNDPIERKLISKLNANKRKVIDRTEELGPSAKNRDLDEECEEDESESKTKAFAKRRPARLTSPFMAKRKHVYSWHILL